MLEPLGIKSLLDLLEGHRPLILALHDFVQEGELGKSKQFSVDDQIDQDLDEDVHVVRAVRLGLTSSLYMHSKRLVITRECYLRKLAESRPDLLD